MRTIRVQAFRFACCVWNELPSPTPATAPPASPATAPPASPAAATSKQSHDQEQQHGTNGSVDGCADHSRTKMDTQLAMMVSVCSAFRCVLVTNGRLACRYSIC
jgi:hypothetical protein